MYVFYGDESGFSKGVRLEPEQPITVYAGVLIDRTKLNKAIATFDGILESINNGIAQKVTELKFNDIKQGKYPYSVNFPKVDDKADLLERIITDFQREISFKIFYSAICDELFLQEKKNGDTNAIKLHHPYTAACYRVLSRIEQTQAVKRNNKGNTFVVLDEQHTLQKQIESLIQSPLHIPKFTQIIDTAYFGKSEYSKLIQIADLIVGIIRFHYCCIHMDKPRNHFTQRIEKIYTHIQGNAIVRECYAGDLKRLYSAIEIENPQRSS